MTVATKLSAKPRNAILANRERIYSFDELAKILPGDRCRETIRYWCDQGRIHPMTRRRVKMEWVYHSSGRASSVEAYWRWMDRLNSEDGE